MAGRESDDTNEKGVAKRRGSTPRMRVLQKLSQIPDVGASCAEVAGICRCPRCMYLGLAQAHQSHHFPA